MPDFLTHQERAVARLIDAYVPTEAEPEYFDKDGKPITAGETMALWMRDKDDVQGGWFPRVAFDRVGDVEVSTVWLGEDHNFGRVGPPLIFETMAFGPDGEKWRKRYATLAEAQAGHAEYLESLRALPADLDGQTDR